MITLNMELRRTIMIVQSPPFPRSESARSFVVSYSASLASTSRSHKQAFRNRKLTGPDWAVSPFLIIRPDSRNSANSITKYQS